MGKGALDSAAYLRDMSEKRVRIHGLMSKPELNGTYGTIRGFDKTSGRYMVRLEGTGGTIKLKPENVEPESEGMSKEENVNEAAAGEEYPFGAQYLY